MIIEKFSVLIPPPTDVQHTTTLSPELKGLRMLLTIVSGSGLDFEWHGKLLNMNLCRA